MDRRTFLFDELAGARTPETAGPGVSIRVAEVRVDIFTSSPAIQEGVRAYFEEYLAEGPADAQVFVEPLHVKELPDLWDDADAEFDTRGDRVVQRDFAARRFERDVVSWVSPAEPDDAVLNLLRWLLPEFLLASSSFLVHAASIVRDGQGYVFLGHSGAGKSTCAEMISDGDHDAIVLGDDAAIIQCGEGGLWLHSAPLGAGFTRTAPPRMRVPLSGIYTLHQSRFGHRIGRLSKAEGMAALLANAMAAEFDRSADGRFSLAERFATACGIRRLDFEKDNAFWPKVRADADTTEEGIHGG
jgi:hypothetical protein